MTLQAKLTESFFHNVFLHYNQDLLIWMSRAESLNRTSYLFKIPEDTFTGI